MMKKVRFTIKLIRSDNFFQIIEDEQRNPNDETFVTEEFDQKDLVLKTKDDLRDEVESQQLFQNTIDETEELYLSLNGDDEADDVNNDAFFQYHDIEEDVINEESGEDDIEDDANASSTLSSTQA